MEEDTKTAGPQRPAEMKISEEKPKTPEKGLQALSLTLNAALYCI